MTVYLESQAKGFKSTKDLKSKMGKAQKKREKHSLRLRLEQQQHLRDQCRQRLLRDQPLLVEQELHEMQLQKQQRLRHRRSKSCCGEATTQLLHEMLAESLEILLDRRVSSRQPTHLVEVCRESLELLCFRPTRIPPIAADYPGVGG